MAIADSKKIQTFINLAAADLLKIRAAATHLEALRTIWQSLSPTPSLTGTPMAGKGAALLTWITSVRTVADNADANSLLPYISPSHPDCLGVGV